MNKKIACNFKGDIGMIYIFSLFQFLQKGRENKSIRTFTSTLSAAFFLFFCVSPGGGGGGGGRGGKEG